MPAAERRFAGALLAPITLLYAVCLIAPISFFLAVSVFRYDPFAMYVPDLTGANFSRLVFDPYYRGIIVLTSLSAACFPNFSFRRHTETSPSNL